jgi:hypothetical protein
MSELRFPLGDIGESTIQFTATDSSDPTNHLGSIELYCPPGVTVGDSINYDRVSLGILGSQGAKNVISSIQSGQGRTDAVTGALLDSFKTGLETGLGMKVATTLGIDENVVNFFAKKIRSPNTNTTFQGVNIRTFGFDFKMVADSKQESEQIKDIIEFFRQNSYPEITGGQGFISYAKFPPLWNIQFLFKKNVNQHMPAIDFCFLQGVSTVYNTQETAFYEETGAPFDVTVSLSFIESRAHNKNSVMERK